jgi:hypothetical protein
VKRINGREVYEHGETFSFPADTPAMPPGITAAYGMKLIGSGDARQWVEATEEGLRTILQSHQYPMAKKTRGFCFYDTSQGGCSGGCISGNEVCNGYSVGGADDHGVLGMRGVIWQP